MKEKEKMNYINPLYNLTRVSYDLRMGTITISNNNCSHDCKKRGQRKCKHIASSAKNIPRFNT
jgi:hypothetical protein